MTFKADPQKGNDYDIYTAFVNLNGWEVTDSVMSATAETVDSFEECVGAGFPVLESSPRQCRTPSNRTFTEEKGCGCGR